MIEYKTIVSSEQLSTDLLNELAREGWRLVTVVRSPGFFPMFTNYFYRDFEDGSGYTLPGE